MKIKALITIFSLSFILVACNKDDLVEPISTVEETTTIVETVEETETTTVEEIESTVEVVESTEETEATTVEEVYSTEDENSILDGLSDEELKKLEKEAEALGTTPEALAEAKKLMEQWAEEDAQKNNTQIDVDYPGMTPGDPSQDGNYQPGQGGELPDHLKGKHIY